MVCFGGIFGTTKVISLYEVLSPRSLGCSGINFVIVIKLVAEVQGIKTFTLLVQKLIAK